MAVINEMKLEFPSKSENEKFSRTAVGAFAALLDPTMEELMEIKTVISEAVSNAVIHGYNGREDGLITVEAKITNAGELIMIVTDQGIGIGDVEKAREPLFTTRAEEERSGMGFTVMESFSDQLDIVSEPEKGTTVTMVKRLDTYYGG